MKILSLVIIFGLIMSQKSMAEGERIIHKFTAKNKNGKSVYSITTKVMKMETYDFSYCKKDRKQFPGSPIYYQRVLENKTVNVNLFVFQRQGNLDLRHSVDVFESKINITFFNIAQNCKLDLLKSQLTAALDEKRKEFITDSDRKSFKVELEGAANLL